MDRQTVYSLSVFDPDDRDTEDNNSQVQRQLVDFVLDFHIDNVFIYRCASKLPQLVAMLTAKQRPNTGECPCQAVLLRH